MNRRPVRLFTHLFARLGVLLALLMLGFGWFAAMRLSKAQRETADRQLRLETQTVAAAIDTFINTQVSSIEALASRFEHAQWPPEQAEAQWALAEFRRWHPSVTVAYLGNAAGRSLVADPAVTPDGAQFANRDYSDRDYFQRLPSHGAVISHVERGKATGRPAVHIAVPVNSPTSERRGFVVAAVGLDELQAIADQARLLEPTGKLVVADRDGRVLVHPDPHAREQMRSVKGTGLFGGGTEALTATDDEAVSARIARAEVTAHRLGWSVAASLPLSVLERGETAALWQALIATVLALLLGLIVTGLTAAQLARPIGELATAAQRVGRGDGELEVKTRSLAPLEVVQLIESVVSMAAQRRDLLVQAQERAAQLDATNRELQDSLRTLNEVQERAAVADRLATVGVLAAGVAHEINNPMAYVKSNLEFALEAVTTGRAQKSLDDVKAALGDAAHGIERVQKIVRDLKVFAREETAETNVPFDLEPMVESALAITSNELRHRARIVRDYHPVAQVVGCESKLAQVLVNMLVNAAQAMPLGNPDANEVKVSLKQDSDEVVIEVSDTGPGIPRELLARVFDPFFTTKPVGQGTGLGLAISRRIVTSMNGEIDVHSELGRGTTFAIRLPPATTATLGQPAPAPAPAAAGAPAAAEYVSHAPLPTVVQQPPAPAAAPAAPKPLSAAPQSRAGRILVADDEAAIGMAMSRLLAAYEVVFCTDGDQALSQLRLDDAFDVIFFDVTMPKRSGIECFRDLERERPELARRVVFMSGGTFDAAAAEFLNAPDRATLAKPFDAAKLRSLVQQRVAARRGPA